MKTCLALFSIFIFSCQSAPTSTIRGRELTAKSSRGSTESSGMKAKQISDGIGENSEPSFSPAGQLLMFVSRKRPEHPQAQIYELNLATNRERRLTFQNGDSFAPAFHPTAPRFFYSSNTDRLKEESYYLDDLKYKYGPKSVPAPVSAPVPAPVAVQVPATDLFDYFSSGLDGRDIQKIGVPTLRANTRTQVSIAVSPDGKRLAIAAGGLWLTNIAGFEAQKLSGARVSRARFSPDGKNLVWSEASAEGARLMTRPVSGAAVATVLLETPGVRYLMPSWNPKNANEIILSADRDSVAESGSPKTPQFDLYVLELEAKCLKRLTETPNIDETDPVFKPDGSGIVFTSNSAGSAQIYMAEYKSPAACLPLIP